MSALTAPVPDVRRRDAAASRRAILDAAEQLFAQRGYDRASLGEIGRRAGVSAALPAYFFGGKEALYAAVLDRLLAERERRLEPLAAAAADQFERTGEVRPALELLITTVALCFFPIEHNDTMLAAMGLDATSERFATARKRHVVDVLERVLRGGAAGER